MIAEAGFNPIDLKPKAPITRLRAFHDGTAALTTVNSCRADMDYCVQIAGEVTGEPKRWPAPIAGPLLC
jgi:hypothetical protein